MKADSNIAPVPNWLFNCIGVGLVVFLGAMYVLPPIKLVNNLFYVGVLLPMLVIVFRFRIEFCYKPFAFIILVTLLYFAFSTFWGGNPSLMKWFQSIKHCIYIGAYLIAVALLFNDKKYFELIVRCLAVAAVIGLSINLCYLILEDKNRMFGVVSFVNAVDLGVAYGFVSLLMLASVIEDRSSWVLGIPILILLIVGMLLTETRTAVIAFFLASLIILVRNISIRHAFPVVLVMIGILLISWQMGWLDRFQDIDMDRTPPRLLIWQEVWEIIQAQGAVWQGLGYHTELSIPVSELGGAYSTTHSQYVGSLMTGGVFGITMTLCLTVYALILAFRQSSSSGRWIILALMVYGSICSLTHGTRLLGHPEDNWLYWWFPVALVLSGHFRVPVNKKVSQP